MSCQYGKVVESRAPKVEYNGKSRMELGRDDGESPGQAEGKRLTNSDHAQELASLFALLKVH